MSAMEWPLILIVVFASSTGDVLCAKGMSEGGELEVRLSKIGSIFCYIITRRMVILGGICYAVAFFSMLALLSIAPLSIAVPATALSFVLDTIGARFLLQEHVPWKRWIGVMCVTVGVILTVRSGRGGAPMP
jgi:drug/metabolite transporter (DMT)-like permease